MIYLDRDRSTSRDQVRKEMFLKQIKFDGRDSDLISRCVKLTTDVGDVV